MVFCHFWGLLPSPASLEVLSDSHGFFREHRLILYWCCRVHHLNIALAFQSTLHSQHHLGYHQFYAAPDCSHKHWLHRLPPRLKDLLRYLSIVLNSLPGAGSYSQSPLAPSLSVHNRWLWVLPRLLPVLSYKHLSLPNKIFSFLLFPQSSWEYPADHPLSIANVLYNFLFQYILRSVPHRSYQLLLSARLDYADWSRQAF